IADSRVSATGSIVNKGKGSIGRVCGARAVGEKRSCASSCIFVRGVGKERSSAASRVEGACGVVRKSTPTDGRIVVGSGVLTERTMAVSRVEVAGGVIQEAGRSGGCVFGAGGVVKKRLRSIRRVGSACGIRKKGECPISGVSRGRVVLKRVETSRRVELA